MPKILLLDQDSQFTQFLAEKIRHSLQFDILQSSSLRDAKDLVKNEGNEIYAVIAFIGLMEDAPNYSPFENIPTIVLTRNQPVQAQKIIQSKDIMDIIMDLNAHNVEYILQLIHRLNQNRHIKVLIADDLDLTRRLIRVLLTNNRFTVIEAKNGVEALDLLEKNPDVKILVVDYQMPKMDGFELTLRVRSQFTKDRLAIIGMSGVIEKEMAVRFLRLGANDFILKPFSLEEFQCRIMQNVQFLESMNAIREASNKDFLTGLYNRRYFFEVGQKYLENAYRNGLTVSVAMMDIDHFKKINDDYGHLVGDKVIRKVAELIMNSMRSTDLICRYGGEEFCVLALHNNPKHIFHSYERLLNKIRSEIITHSDIELKCTISIGVATIPGENLPAMIQVADNFLYEAKRSGRDQIKPSENTIEN